MQKDTERIVDMLEKRMDMIEREISSIKSSIENLNKKLDGDKIELDGKIGTILREIAEMKIKIQALKQEVNKKADIEIVTYIKEKAILEG